MPYLDSYIDPSLNPDDLIRKRNLMMGFPNITGFDQPLDQPPSEPTPWYLAQNQTPEQKAGESPLQQPTTTPQVQGTGGPPAQPPAAANAAALSPYAEDPFKLAAESKEKLAKGYDPTADLQGVASDIRQTREAIPSVGPDSPMGRSAAALQSLGRRPTGYDVDPATGKPLYPVNKLEKVLLSPFMFKQMIHDPLGTREKMDVLTRKGYGAAEQQWYDTYEQRKRDFDLNTIATNQIMKSLTERLQADNSMAGISRTLWDVNKDIANMPLQSQSIATSMVAQQANTVREGAPKYNLENVMTAFTKEIGPDGKPVYHETIAYPKTFPDGRPPEWYEPGRNTPLKDPIITGKAESANIGGLNQLILDGERQFFVKNGRMPEGEEKTAIVQKAEKDYNQPSEERQIRLAQEHADIKALQDEKNKYTVDMRKVKQMTDTQLVNLEGLQKTVDTALDPHNPNAVGAMMGVVEFATTLSSPGQRMTRYQSKEIGDIVKAPGRLQAIGAAIKNWTDNGAPIPAQVLQDIRRLAAVQTHDFKVRRDIYAAADQAVSVAQTPYEVNYIRQLTNEELDDAFKTEAGETPEQERARLKAEQDARARRKKESLSGR